MCDVREGVAAAACHCSRLPSRQIWRRGRRRPCCRFPPIVTRHCYRFPSRQIWQRGGHHSPMLPPLPPPHDATVTSPPAGSDEWEGTPRRFPPIRDQSVRPKLADELVPPGTSDGVKPPLCSRALPRETAAGSATAAVGSATAAVGGLATAAVDGSGDGGGGGLDDGGGGGLDDSGGGGLGALGWVIPSVVVAEPTAADVARARRRRCRPSRLPPPSPSPPQPLIDAIKEAGGDHVRSRTWQILPNTNNVGATAEGGGLGAEAAAAEGGRGAAGGGAAAASPLGLDGAN
uniref:Uncharacterized protein n=1 Tax=Oryza nivara TaxID=4536 RepID=A0A0E0G4U8_ORYNI